MHKSMTTLGEVLNKIDIMSENCTDELIRVTDISFDHLESINAPLLGMYGTYSYSFVNGLKTTNSPPQFVFHLGAVKSTKV